jgi:hypothetical protein
VFYPLRPKGKICGFQIKLAEWHIGEIFGYGICCSNLLRICDLRTKKPTKFENLRQRNDSQNLRICECPSHNVHNVFSLVSETPQLRGQLRDSLTFINAPRLGIFLQDHHRIQKVALRAIEF